MKNNQKAYLILLIFGLLALALVLFAIWPLYSEISNASGSLISIKNDTAALQIQDNEIENFKKNYPDYQSNLEMMNHLFIDPQNPVDFITFLENTASDSGISAKISLTPPSDQASTHVITFELYSSDNFLKILHLCEEIENGPYLVDVENLTIANAQEQGKSNNASSGNVNATFLINAFTK